MSYTVLVPKHKYRIVGTAKHNAYRARTGPKCCNAGCGNKSGSKMTRAAMGRGIR